jgi:hypothetical protein
MKWAANNPQAFDIKPLEPKRWKKHHIRAFIARQELYGAYRLDAQNATSC